MRIAHWELSSVLLVELLLGPGPLVLAVGLGVVAMTSTMGDDTPVMENGDEK